MPDQTHVRHTIASVEQRTDAVQAALKAGISSGTYDALLVKWNLQDQGLKDAPINTGQ